MKFDFKLSDNMQAIRSLYIEENYRFDRKYIFQIGHGRGLCAELIHILKSIEKCFCNGVQFYVGESVNPRGYAIENGWSDYFVPLFNVSNGRFLQVFNRPHFPFGRIPVIKACSRLVLYSIYGRHCYMFDGVPGAFQWESFRGRLNLSSDYWEAMSEFVASIFVYNERAQESVNRYAEGLDWTADNYIAAHIRRGDKITESPYVEVEKYAEQIEGISGYSMPIYTATDNVATIARLREVLGNNYDVFGYEQGNRRGYDQGVFNRASAEKRWSDTTFFLFELELLKNSIYFVGASPSNVFFWVRYCRGNKNMFDVNKDVC